MYSIIDEIVKTTHWLSNVTIASLTWDWKIISSTVLCIVSTLKFFTQPSCHSC